MCGGDYACRVTVDLSDCALRLSTSLRGILGDKRHCRANPPNIIRASKRTSRKTVNLNGLRAAAGEYAGSSSPRSSWYSTTYVKFKSSLISQPISKTLLPRFRDVSRLRED
jgi:hypothetical protein